MALTINYGEIISAAQDYMDARNRFSRKYPGHNYIDHSNPELYDAYRWSDRAERALTVACYVIGIWPAIAFQAARLYNRAYDRAFRQGRDPGIIDEQRLLEALIENAE